MIEHRPGLKIFCHAILLLGVAAVSFPLWVAFVASTHTAERMLEVPLPLWPGTHLLEN
jgi:sn-glycerol 3-phosphate transport system permease protein